MADHESTARWEYYELIPELVEAGKLPKSYASTVRDALTFIYEPKDEPGRLIYEKFKASIPNVPKNIRIELDTQILDMLVLDKKLSAVSRDRLLPELSKANLYHGKSAVDLEFEALDAEFHELMEESDRIDREFDEANKNIKEAERRAPFEIAGVLSVIAVVVVMAWSAFANWVNSQPDSYRQSDEKTIPGLGITASEYQRRSDCLNFGC